MTLFTFSKSYLTAVATAVDENLYLPGAAPPDSCAPSGTCPSPAPGHARPPVPFGWHRGWMCQPAARHRLPLGGRDILAVAYADTCRLQRSLGT